MSNYKFNRFLGGVYNTTVSDIIDLEQMLTEIKYPTQELINQVNAVRQASAADNEELKADLKKGLPIYLPCVQVSGGKKIENIVSFTGLTVLDFDHMKPDYAIEFKYHIFNKYDWILASWISPSGRGVKCLVKIPLVTSLKEYKERYNALTIEFQYNHFFDTCNKNVVLSLYYSTDIDLLLRPNSTIYTDSVELEELPVVDVSDYTVMVTIQERDQAIQHISNTIGLVENSGHQLLSTAAIKAGNYAAWGYWSEQEAVNLLNNLIVRHPYLIKKEKTYKLTAKHMIHWGMTHPVEIKNTNNYDS